MYLPTQTSLFIGKIKLQLNQKLYLATVFSVFSFNTGPNEVGQAQLVQVPANAECSI